ncbi:MAG: MFS transporter [Gammaproteobacteria bacterium]|nr:MFS transporter [Gammaproteobacteria bacterium]
MTGPRSLRHGQVRIIALLFCGYAACYYCRADLSVSTPLLADELSRHGLDHATALVRIGTISSLGVLAYALGKFFLTGLGDYWGGRRNFNLGMSGALLCTLLFAFGGGIPLFTGAWIGNRLIQSLSWAGLLKVTSKWFDYSVYGSIVGVLSISYLVGDAVARQQMGLLIAHGYGWRAVFVFAALVAALTLGASLLWLRESRVEEGHGPATPNPLSLFAAAEAPPASLGALLRPLLGSGAFLLVCALSFTCTIIRETFNTWNPTYLRDYVGLSTSHAATLSGVFPAVGAVSVLGAGWLSDRLGITGRSLLLTVGLGACAGALLLLAAVPHGPGGSSTAIALSAAVALLLLGPYSYLGGAFALDFGGKQAGAVSSGIIDGVGYLGGALAGDTVARLVRASGWNGVFTALALVSAVAAVAAAALHFLNRRAARGAHA